MTWQNNRTELLAARDKIARQLEMLRNPTAAFYGTLDLKPDNRQLIEDLQSVLEAIDIELEYQLIR